MIFCSEGKRESLPKNGVWLCPTLMTHGAQVPGAAKLASILDAGILTFISLTEHDEFLGRNPGFDHHGSSFLWIVNEFQAYRHKLCGLSTTMTPH